MLTIRFRSIQLVALGLALALVAGWMFSSWQAQAAIDPAESTVVPVTPTRVLDSRDPIDLGLPGPFQSQVPQKLQVTGSIATTDGDAVVVPAGATGVLLNVTPVRPSADGFISIQPGDAVGAPSTSNVNFAAGAANPNAVTVSLPTSGPDAGTIRITYDALGVVGPSTEVLIDVVGYTTNAGLQEIQSRLDGAIQQGDIVLSHGTSQLTGSGLAPAAIGAFSSGNTIQTGTAHMSLVGPAILDGVEYGLKSVEYCIVEASASGFISSVSVVGMNPVNTLVTDGTDRTTDGCYTVEVNDATAKAYDFSWLAGGGDQVRIAGLQSTWAPVSTLAAS